MGRKKVKNKATEHICLTVENKNWVEDAKMDLKLKTANDLFSYLRKFFSEVTALRKKGSNVSKRS